ncbi:hypothetical protein EVA_15063 [gut metagenome]|uniref:Uncharacterized protein n=1 Tax=gut metagenome TaxID=749906 RepID=J9FPF5_9ZZZZ
MSRLTTGRNLPNVLGRTAVLTAPPFFRFIFKSTGSGTN